MTNTPNSLDKPSKTRVSNYRKMYIAYLIDTGVNTPKELQEATGLSRRGVQAALKALIDVSIVYERKGGVKNCTYMISDWAAINRDWITANLDSIESVIGIEN